MRSLVHSNSYPRAKLNDKSPFEVAEFLMAKSMLAKLSLRKIPVEEIQLRPALLKAYKIVKVRQEPVSLDN